MSETLGKIETALRALAAARGIDPGPGPALLVEAKLVAGRYLANRRADLPQAQADAASTRAGLWQPSHFNKEIADVLDRIRAGIGELAAQEAEIFDQLNIDTETLAAVKHCDSLAVDRQLAQLMEADAAMDAPHRRTVAVIIVFEAAFCGALAVLQKHDAARSMPVRLNGEMWFAYYRAVAEAVGLKAMNAARDYQTMRRVRDILQETG